LELLKSMKRFHSLFICLLLPLYAFSQLKPIGSWTEHLPFKKGRALDLNGDLVYAGTTTGLFTFNSSDNSISRYSTVNRLNEININALEYSTAAEALVIVYNNLNIDVLRSSTTVNIPSIRDASLQNKFLNSLYIKDEFAYLSTGFGIVKLNIERSEISETYQFAPGGGAINVNATLLDDNFIYAATDQGLFYADLNSNLLDFNSWLSLPQQINNIIDLFSLGNETYVVADRATSDTIFRLDNTTLVPELALSGKNYLDNDTDEDRLLVAYASDVSIYDAQLQSISSFTAPLSNLQDIKFNSSKVYILNNFDPLLEYNYQGDRTNFIKPKGPFEENIFDMQVEDGVLWGVSGGYDPGLNNQFRGTRIYRFENGEWLSYIDFSEPSLNGTFDVMSVNIREGNPNEVYFGSWGTGLLEFKNNTPFTLYDETNSILKDRTLWAGWCGVGETIFDERGNLWIVNSYTSSLLSVRTPSNNWSQFAFGGLASGEETPATEIRISDAGLIWLALPRDNHILVFDYNQTLGNPTDDRTYIFKQGVGAGNLPGIRGITMEFDLDNQLWVGTSDGIAVKFNPDNVFEENINQRDFERILIDDGENVEILLAGTEISDIEIDGANRKWVATNGSGVFLLSPDGKEVLSQFTTDNSPLFSDNIISIAIDDQSGEVYFSTASGLISYRSDVVSGNESMSEVKVFPNPVRETYNGPIAIDGLLDQTTVKITDINGRLINEVESTGGRALWNGRNFEGDRVSTGVYLVFASGTTEEDNLRTAIGKILFIR